MVAEISDIETNYIQKYYAIKQTNSYFGIYVISIDVIILPTILIVVSIVRNYTSSVPEAIDGHSINFSSLCGDRTLSYLFKNVCKESSKLSFTSYIGL